MTYLRRIIGSVAFYPITCVYISGVALWVLYAQGHLDLSTGIFAFGAVTVAAILYAVLREMRVMQALLDQQLTEIKELRDMLKDAGIVVPERTGR